MARVILQALTPPMRPEVGPLQFGLALQLQIQGLQTDEELNLTTPVGVGLGVSQADCLFVHWCGL
jgi:hypothetical protein